MREKSDSDCACSGKSKDSEKTRDLKFIPHTDHWYRDSLETNKQTNKPTKTKASKS